MNWRTASIKDRKVLYEVVSDLIWQNDMEWKDVYNAAFPSAKHVGEHYHDGFRAGKIGRRRAMWIYKWLQSDHPTACDLLDQKLAMNDQK